MDVVTSEHVTKVCNLFTSLLLELCKVVRLPFLGLLDFFLQDIFIIFRIAHISNDCNFVMRGYCPRFTFYSTLFLVSSKKQVSRRGYCDLWHVTVVASADTEFFSDSPRARDHGQSAVVTPRAVFSLAPCSPTHLQLSRMMQIWIN